MEDKLRETLKELVFWASDLRDKSKEASEYWDDYAPDPEADHPSNHLFSDLRHRLDFDDALDHAKNMLDNER